MNLNKTEAACPKPKTKSMRIARRTSPGPAICRTTEVKHHARTQQPRQTRVTAKVDVGFGNSLFIRGCGEGLSWEQGRPLTCHDADSWVWVGGPVTERIAFKLLLNDQKWAHGEDHVIEPGAALEVRPTF